MNKTYLKVQVNEYDIIRLDIPIADPIEKKNVLEYMVNMRHQRIGMPIGIVKILEQIARDICEQWETTVKQYMLNNLTGTQYYYTNIPKVYPMSSDINQTLESRNATPDSAMNEVDWAIAYDINELMPSTLTKRPFGPNKETAPRIRFYIETDKFQYRVSAQRKETQIIYKTYAHTGKMATLMAQGLEYYFNAHREKLLELGVQHHYVIKTMGKIEQDPKTKMFYRSLNLYMKYEEWFIGNKAPIIEKITMSWDVNPTVNEVLTRTTQGGIGRNI